MIAASPYVLHVHDKRGPLVESFSGQGVLVGKSRNDVQLAVPNEGAANEKPRISLERLHPRRADQLSLLLVRRRHLKLVVAESADLNFMRPDRGIERVTVELLVEDEAVLVLRNREVPRAAQSESVLLKQAGGPSLGSCALTPRELQLRGRRRNLRRGTSTWSCAASPCLACLRAKEPGSCTPRL